jgi:hypothetical protein
MFELAHAAEKRGQRLDGDSPLEDPSGLPNSYLFLPYFFAPGS